MAQINPHINFNGNAEEAFTFYQSIFGGTISKIIRFREIANKEFPIPDCDAEKIMHIALPIGNNFLMGNDVPTFMGLTNENEHRSKISITALNKDEATHLFKGLSSGGQVEVPLEEGPAGSLFAMFRDRYGIEWMIQYDGIIV